MYRRLSLTRVELYLLRDEEHVGERGVDEPPDLGRHDQPVLKARVRLDGIVGHAVDLVAMLGIDGSASQKPERETALT